MAVLLGAGCAFFVAGAVGLLRFPDTLTRLHALTKADNVGLGLIALAAMLWAGDALLALKIALVWFVTLLSSATASYLIARVALVDAGADTRGEGREP